MSTNASGTTSNSPCDLTSSPSSPKRPRFQPQQNVADAATPNNPCSNDNTKRSVINVDDNSVQVMSPPPPSLFTTTTTSSTTNMDVDDVVVESSNATNPNIAYPHARSNCGVHAFSINGQNACNMRFCEKCYCVVCNKLASECLQWTTHAHVVQQQDKHQNSSNEPTQEETSAPQQAMRNPFLGRMPHQDAHFLDADIQDYYARLHPYKRTKRDQYNKGGKKESDMRITELLAKKLDQAIQIHKDKRTRSKDEKKMEGDILQLGLHKSFFVEGVRIGWPFPVIMTPQRQMALHLIKALKNKRHVVLESPTGTGKSAAILCATLAWQRYHTKTHGPNETKAKIPTTQKDAAKDEKHVVPKIIYCSRTHSQVAQMIASLKKTPYRPRMSVLGSRDRLCIHQNIVNREKSDKQKDRVNVNRECQARVKNTERIRKALSKSVDFHYNDDHPPLEFPGDGLGGNDAGSTQEEGDDTPQEASADPDGLNDDETHQSSQWILSRSTKKLTCPHYRQLSTTRHAERASSRFALDQAKIDCCQVGGEKTKLGVHDIEDLVSFGMNPHVERNVAVYRPKGTKSFQMQLQHANVGCNVLGVHKNGAADKEGTIRAKDRVVGVNGNDVREWSFEEITGEISNTNEDYPLLVDVIHHGADMDENDDMEETYSSHSSCPYYLSRALSKHAELIFAPYNYVLDPHIRKSLDIDLNGAVVVLDEAHNVEDTLKESGSGKFGEFELCDVLSMLAFHSTATKSQFNKVEIGSEEIDLCEIAHELLLFVEKLLLFMRGQRDSFEKSPGNVGAAAAIREYQKYHYPDDREFQITFDGPNGYGVRNKAVGCQRFFKERIQISKSHGETLQDYAKGLENKVSGRQDGGGGAKWGSSVMDKMLELITKFSYAMQAPEHFYVSCVAQANGSLDFASGQEDEASPQRQGNRFKKKPKSIPLAHPRSTLHKRLPVPTCYHRGCRSDHFALGQGVRHGDFCNGDTPNWETHLVLKLLSPGKLMQDITSQCRTLVLASGSLAPIQSLCGELNLVPSKAQDPSLLGKDSPYRLQLQPKPLEANHVIDLQKQLFAVSIGNFPDGSPLTVTHSNYRQRGFYPRLGDAIATVIEAIPRGGVLVFLPSYSFLKNCIKCWNPQQRRGFGSYGGNEDDSPEIWARFLQSKGKVVVEPSGSQTKFEAARKEYTDKIKQDGNCILLAVFRGKMSEGISFNDDNARGVICVGVPFPNMFDQAIKAKKHYNDEQRKLQGRTALLPGGEWVSQQAYRAIAQALGRCIRHAADYGTVVLVDSRHCDDGSPIENGVCLAHQKLPKWMRHHVRTLRMGRLNMGHYGVGNTVTGGYQGLSAELRKFFAHAPIHSHTVIEKWKSDLAAAQEREKMTIRHTFDGNTGKWTATKSAARKTKAKKQPPEPRKSIGRQAKTVSPFFKVTQDSPQSVGTGQCGSPETPAPVMSAPSSDATTAVATPLSTSAASQSLSTPKDEKQMQGQDENAPENIFQPAT